MSTPDHITRAELLAARNSLDKMRKRRQAKSARNRPMADYYITRAELLAALERAAIAWDSAAPETSELHALAAELRREPSADDGNPALGVRELEAPSVASQLASVPRGHCDRCGMSRRSTCAGCGAPYQEEVPRFCRERHGGLAAGDPRLCDRPLPCPIHLPAQPGVAPELDAGASKTAVSAAPDRSNVFDEEFDAHREHWHDAFEQMLDRPPTVRERTAFYDGWYGAAVLAMGAPGTEAECAELRERLLELEVHFEAAKSYWRGCDVTRIENQRRAEAAEKRVAELQARNDRLRYLLDGYDPKWNEPDGHQERAEAELPECVREWRELGDARDRYGVGPTIGFATERANNAAQDCLEWLAEAPASQVARLALRGDALRTVREWQQCEDRVNKDGIVDAMHTALDTATVLDADALVPLLRVVRGLLGDGHQDSKSKLDAAWDALPQEWRALVESGAKP